MSQRALNRYSSVGSEHQITSGVAFYTALDDRSHGSDRGTPAPGATPTENSDYLSAHLRPTRERFQYTRASYAKKAWVTFGKLFPVDRSSSILEIGPGDCEFIEYLAQSKGYKNTQVLDTSSEVILVADELGIPATLTSDTAETLNSIGTAFDVVVLLHVLEHVPKYETIRFLESIHRTLRKDGRLLLEVPNMGDPLNGTYYRYADFTHEVGFTEESLTYVLRQAGFSSIHFQDSARANRAATRQLQRVAQTALRFLMIAINFPNGRQMQRRIGPVLSVCAFV